MFLQAKMWAEAEYSYKAICVTSILIIFQLSVASLCCEWHDGKEPFRLVIVRICVLNLVVVTEHCSLLKRHVRDLHGTGGLDPAVLGLWGILCSLIR